jgi:uncharacterized membrane protein
MSLPDGACRQGRLQCCALLLLGLGLLLRLYSYFCDPSIWFDEAAVMLNVLDKSYAGLLGPLEHAANGPPLYLWLEKGLVSWLGDSSLVWRLPALVAGCLGLVIFAGVARRLLSPGGAAWAIGLFAFSDRLLWHTVEVRPYTIDTLVAVGVTALWLGTASGGTVNRLLLFASLGPPLLCLSYPAVFVCAALALALLPDVWRSRRVAAWLCYGLYLAGLALTFCWMLAGPIRAQTQGMRAAGFEDDWIRQMLDRSSIAGALRWPLAALFEALRYDLRPTGGLLLVPALVGAVWVVRNRGWRVALLVFGPLLAVLAAACLHRYPCGYGRPILFLTPAAALLVGAATPVILRWCWGGAPDGRATPRPSPRRWCARLAGLAVLALVLTPISAGLSRLWNPWPRPDARRAAEYILSHRRGDDMVVMTTWDQLYFYRHFDPRWRCWGLRPGAANHSRCWVTLNAHLWDVEDEKEARIEKGAWTVCEERQFGQAIVVLLRRARPPG